MKIILILFVFSIYTYADTIAKVWQISKENDIVNVEDEPVHYDSTLSAEQKKVSQLTGLLHEVSNRQDISALPLAKTIPVEQADDTAPVMQKHSDSPESHIDALKKVIASETDSQKEKKTKTLSDIVVSKKVNSLQAVTDAEFEHEGKIRKIVPFLSDVEHFFALHSQYYTYLVASIILFFLLLPLLFRRKGSLSKPADTISTVTKSQMQMQLGLFTRLQGEVHQQFLNRKQNIIFNNDFTQYQKAKALLDLEKEYIDLEYNYLPKLFCDDFEAYIEAEAVLLARSELREIIHDFIEATLRERMFTKFQQEQILRKIRSSYRTTHYNWQIEDIVESEQHNQGEHAYLLQ